MAHSPVHQPLSDDEYATLGDLLDARSPFDTDGLLGVLHAVAVAPSMVPPSAWLPVVLPDGFGAVDAAGAAERAGLVFRLFNEVLDSVNRGAAFLMPEADDVDGCVSFAAGYAAGAELDAVGDARQTIRRDMHAIINSAHDSFTKVRRAALTKQPAHNAHRVGRNEPCPCGSGKKFKRCCIDQKPALASH